MKYRTLEIQTHNLKEEEKEILNLLNKKYPSSDIVFSTSNDSIFIQLRQLDFLQFKTDIEQYTQNYSNLQSVLEAIQKSSYEVNGKKRQYTEYNEERKVKNRANKEIKRETFFYTSGNNFVKENKEIPKDYENTIVCGDSEQILKNLPDNCIDLVFTSPPYNFGLEYNSSEDDKHWNEYFDKLFRVFDECVRVLKYGGRIIVNTQPLFSDYIPSHHIISNYLMHKKLIWKGEILWEKNNYNCKYTSWGSWKSPSSPYLKYTWEFLEIYCKGSLKKEGKAENIDITADEFKQYVVAKWSIAPERNMKVYDHPAMFPEELVKRVLKLFSFENDIILDPFNGAGTTTYVANTLHRRYLGIDISEKYVQTAKNRIKSILL